MKTQLTTTIMNLNKLYRLLFKSSLLILFVSLSTVHVITQADEVKGSLPTPGELPKLGNQWQILNPYRGIQSNSELIVKLGNTLFNENCARCHGVDALKPAGAPELRKLDSYCRNKVDREYFDACMKDTDQYFLNSVLEGKTRIGVTHMPAWKGLLSQESIWAIKNFLESVSQSTPP